MEQNDLLSESVLEVPSSRTRCQALTAGEQLPTRHVLIGGRPHKIPNELELMCVAFTRQDRLPHDHLGEDAPAAWSEQRSQDHVYDLPDSPDVYCGGVLLQLE